MTTPSPADEDLLEALRWTEERLAAGEAVPLGPLAERLRRRWARVEARELEPASQALLQMARLLEKRARLFFPPEPAPEEAAPEEEAGGGPFLPGEELLERLAALEAFQDVAKALDAYQRQARRRFPRGAAGRPRAETAAGTASPDALLAAFRAVWERARERTRQVERETLTVRDRMWEIARRAKDGPVAFDALFDADAGRRDVIVTFLALLELIRLGEVVARQEGPRAPIVIFPAAVQGGGGR
ncbi:MAG: segregation/condensation protein A [Firmicutes bacterium]|nr:segregation/condensation protein A [Bacillota bacterium]